MANHLKAQILDDLNEVSRYLRLAAQMHIYDMQSENVNSIIPANFLVSFFGCGKTLESKDHRLTLFSKTILCIAGVKV